MKLPVFKASFSFLLVLLMYFNIIFTISLLSRQTMLNGSFEISRWHAIVFTTLFQGKAGLQIPIINNFWTWEQVDFYVVQVGYCKIEISGYFNFSIFIVKLFQTFLEIM